MSLAVPFYSVRLNYEDDNVNTTDWTQLVAALPKTCQLIEIFDSSGESLSLGLGADGEEEQFFIITPGGNGQLPVFLPTLSRISLKAISGDASSGEIIVNFYQQ